MNNNLVPLLVILLTASFSGFLLGLCTFLQLHNLGGAFAAGITAFGVVAWVLYDRIMK